jgi:adenosine deaminase
VGSALSARGTAGVALLVAALAGCSAGVRTSSAPSAPISFGGLSLDHEQLRRLLADMPKGGDLHNHMSGSVYAESFVRWAAEDGVCIVRATSVSVRGPCAQATDRVPAKQVLADSALLRTVIDAWSMRDWHPGGESGADHFFATFGKYSIAASAERTGDMIAEDASRAAAQHVSYLELMTNPEGGNISRLGTRAGWSTDFAQMRSRIDGMGLHDSLVAISRTLDRAEARERELLHCGTPQADDGCNVVVRYVYQVIRSRPREQVFAQILAGYEFQALDSRVVAFNLVAPEHGDTAVADFSLHMSMIDKLHADFPNVHITLHAGELAPGMVPPDALRSHIRQSIDVGHAQRIGHGVDVLGEDNSSELLREMAQRNILVEIALTSNDLILGVRGARHPLHAYLAAGVPVALATDDPGVSRSDMTQEFVKAVEEQHIDYPTLKRMVRNSLAYAFVEPSVKALLQAQLEADLIRFERDHHLTPSGL